MPNMDTPTSSEKPQVQEYVYQLAGVDTTLFAACYSGLYRSDDGGQTWQTAYASLKLSEPLPTMAVAVSPAFDHDSRVFAGLSGGILRSLNDGRIWESVTLPPPPPVVSAVALSPDFEKDGIVFAATMEDGVLFSSDRGGRFTAWNFGLLDLNIFSLAVSPNFAEDETVFVGAQTSIFRSTNGGRAWREVDLPAGYDAVLSLVLSPDFAQDGTLLAGTEMQGLWLSADRGKSWEQLGKHLFTEAVNAVYLSPDFSAYPEILALHGGTLNHSADCGNTWTPWREAILADQDVTTVLAPEGFGPGALVLVGLADGNILRLD
ncbi:MAG: hypothetical protein JXB30_08695 [Anaerolineae bacterium]|nr:hypothetical protein [Anaerolineae bacterium]